MSDYNRLPKNVQRAATAAGRRYYRGDRRHGHNYRGGGGGERRHFQQQQREERLESKDVEKLVYPRGETCKVLNLPIRKKPRWYRKDWPTGFYDQLDALCRSSTVYVGNISFYTSDAQIRALFSQCGTVKNVIMGIDKFKKTPCGFCFVEFTSHEEAITADVNMSGILLDGQAIKVEIDWGWSEGREYGRSFFGGQVRDAFRVDFNENRGGYGECIKRGIKQPGMVDFDYKVAMASAESPGVGQKRVRMDDSLPSNRGGTTSRNNKRSRHEDMSTVSVDDNAKAEKDEDENENESTTMDE